MFCYVHIPFCESKCKYCRFASIGGISQILTQKYITHIIKDIERFSASEQKLESIYFGGGTPSILHSGELKKIMKSLKNKFGYEKNIEITLETTPQNITKENIISWQELGINRLSIGVQSLNEFTLKEIGRSSKEIIFSGLELLRNSQIKNISIDLIIGLPHVKVGEVKEHVHILLHTFAFITHVSVYMLEDYYLPDNNGGKFDTLHYPTTWEHLGLAETQYQDEYTQVYEYLKELGFGSYEISNFARQGYACKHNQSYWNHSEVVGFGLGSHSFIHGKRYGYVDDFLGYYAGKREYEETLTQKEFFLEKVMFGLRTSGLTKELYASLQQEKINQYLKDGFLKMENELLKVTLKGIPVLDSIILEITLKLGS